MSKSYTDLERENAELQQKNQYLQRAVQELKDSVENKKQQIHDRDMLLLAVQNRLKAQKHFWQRIKQNKDVPYLLDMIAKVWSKSK